MRIEGWVTEEDLERLKGHGLDVHVFIPAQHTGTGLALILVTLENEGLMEVLDFMGLLEDTDGT